MVSINYWELSDRGSWIKGGGLINDEYHPKPAYERLKQLIKGEWLTQSFTTTTDENGEIHFDGFYGGYELVLPRRARQHQTLLFSHKKNRETEEKFIL